MSRILVTGATGHLGKATLEHLLKNTTADNIVALARDENKAAALKEKGVEVRIGDFEDTASLDTAMQGISKVLLISGTELHRFQQHKNVVDAAKKADVKYIVYTSVSMNDVNTSAIKFLMASHFQTEDYIKESGLTYTLLRNSLYADTIPMFLGEKVLETGIYLPAGEGKISFALRDEMAEATAKVLTTDEHENKTYSLTNVETYTYQDIAQILSEISGKNVNYFSPAVDEYVKTLTDAGVPKAYIDVLSGFALAMAKDEFGLVSNDLGQLLGRKPSTIKALLKTIY
ncbi:SDR family oxidoreductase [Parapedobacter tibetensis]|uniref:SDR family oxidoreductase n=1 Tax=Parapedobacter tibetensis TaxID=2972951 RepID=UPI00214D800A|nr:SDR family oxidoreductase [Parapedobacter tibetensis]